MNDNIPLTVIKDVCFIQQNDKNAHSEGLLVMTHQTASCRLSLLDSTGLCTDLSAGPSSAPGGCIFATRTHDIVSIYWWNRTKSCSWNLKRHISNIPAGQMNIKVCVKHKHQWSWGQRRLLYSRSPASSSRPTAQLSPKSGALSPWSVWLLATDDGERRKTESQA